VSLAHPPGRAQVDFGEAGIYLGGVKTRIHYFCLYMPHSDAIFVKAYPAETTEAFLDGHVAAFTWLGGVPHSRFFTTRLSPSGLREISRIDPEYWVNQAEIQSIQNRLRRMSGACTNSPVQSINLPACADLP
jgi:hypothetical protein